MSKISVREFLRSASCSEDENDALESISSRLSGLGHDDLLTNDRRDSQWLLRRHDTIFDYEYRYRNDHCAYPHVKPRFVNVNHVVVLVGLPARGKTYIARKLCRYLNWSGISSKVLSVGDYRRKAAGTDLNHEFFKDNNSEAFKIRLESYMLALEDGAAWLTENDQHKVLIMDATNGTRARRKIVHQFCEKNNFKTFFIESICDEPEIIESFWKEVQMFSPDYVTFDQDLATKDFKLRLKHYEDGYEGISEHCELERTFSYIKTINAGKQFLVNNVDGYLQSQVVYYLMNIHTQKRSLYFTVHGECDYNVAKELGGHSGLTETGIKYAKALNNFLKNENIKDLKVWTSSIKGSIETAEFVNGPSEIWRYLDCLDCGECHGKKFSDLAQIFPGIFTDDKGPLDFHWRYPGGESYQDMLSRLEPVIMELERQRDVLVIMHRTTMRCLLAYFLDHNPDEVSHIKVPLHTVFKLTPVAYGCRVEKATLNKSGALT